MSINIAIVGAGVMGLSTAVQLLQKGYSVNIYTDLDPALTTSTVAVAIWMPFGVESDQIDDWSHASLAHYKQMQNNSESGVVWRNHTEFFNIVISKPHWMNLLEEGTAPQCQIPHEVASIYSIKLPNIDTRKYIIYLLNTVKSLGGNIIQRRITHFDELNESQIIINCAGFGAKHLTGDNNLYPIKGQRFSVKQPCEKITESILYTNNDLITVIVPHTEHVIIGVSYLVNNDSLNYDMIEEKKQLLRACEFFPQLADATILERRVGLRPGRKNGVRLETEMTKDKKLIIHSYGHAGGGISLAPGCAASVAKIVENWVR